MSNEYPVLADAKLATPLPTEASTNPSAYTWRVIANPLAHVLFSEFRQLRRPKRWSGFGKGTGYR
jgi:hypothetical protein